jgi:hypothetical protein
MAREARGKLNKCGVTVARRRDFKRERVSYVTATGPPVVISP